MDSESDSNLVKTLKGWKYFCQDSSTAEALNRLLGYPYGREANFVKSSSEGIFNFKEEQLKSVISLLKNYKQSL